MTTNPVTIFFFGYAIATVVAAGIANPLMYHLKVPWKVSVAIIGLGGVIGGIVCALYVVLI